MKPLSEVLTELAERVKGVEDSITGNREKSRAALEARRQELEDELDTRKHDFDAAVARLQDAPRNWWSGTKDSVERQVTAMRSDFMQWQRELREKSAQRAAEYAEENAETARQMAEYFVNAAEWAAVQARLARSEADELTENDE